MVVAGVTIITFLLLEAYTTTSVEMALKMRDHYEPVRTLKVKSITVVATAIGADQVTVHIWSSVLSVKDHEK